MIAERSKSCRWPIDGRGMEEKVYPYHIHLYMKTELNKALVTIMLLYAVTGLLALLLAPLYVVNQLILFENPENPLNVLYLILTVVVVFIIILVIAKLRLEILFRGLFYFSAFTVLTISISVILPNSLWPGLSVIASFSILILLNRFYKWYLVDAVGVFLSASIAAWFGASLAPQMIAMFIVLMALYDYFAVKSGRMVSIAEKALKMGLPTMIMSPMKEMPEDFKTGNGGKRGAFLGLGDLAFPHMLTVSTFLGTESLFAAILVLSSSIAGLILVLYVVHRSKRPQPGLPYIGLGAVLGWLVSTLLV